MPLDQIVGERIQGLDSPCALGKLLDWGGTVFFDAAAKKAEAAFTSAGGTAPMVFDHSQVNIQIYPFEAPPLLVILFCRTVGPHELYSYQKIALSPGVVADLKNVGLWPSLN